MDLARLATPEDHAKLQYLRNIYTELLSTLDTAPFHAATKRDARPIIEAASRATIYDGEYDGVIRKYYAFRGDFTRVWFTLDLFTAMPDDLRFQSNRDEMDIILRTITQALLQEVRSGLVEELRLF